MNTRFSAVAVVFGSTADRYVLQGYTAKRSLEEVLASGDAMASTRLLREALVGREP
jgi:hypothetical protein